ncbi:hypothetical protein YASMINEVIRUS_677 [Yasminevirus sp. GU-2018]|uniref:Mitochondrial carrier protein n=1 Tax=Yasminevirus sp. GU-2018 TaxID=2420051 RepID=A0A5K0U9Q6_9VIRU|nr:hypothetical protein YASMINEVIRUS_677 [Yasminevirus sp. GU-2018]
MSSSQNIDICSNEVDLSSDTYLNVLASGTVGAVLNTYVGHPFDTVRVRMQKIDTSYNSATACLKHTYKTEGVSGLFRGVVPSLYCAVAENSVVFSVNEVLKRYVYNTGTKTSLSLHQDMLIGSVSGLCATIVACPFETLKCQIQVDSNKTSSSLFKIIKDVFSGTSNTNLRLYSGFGASCIRNVPYYLTFFPFYSRYIDVIDYIKSRSLKLMDNGLSKKKPGTSKITTDKSANEITDKHGLIECAIAGGLSGATSWACVYPLDVIKCNQQIHPQKINMLNMFALIVRQRGYSGLFAGFYPTIVRSFPANAALLLGVELTNKAFKHK